MRRSRISSANRSSSTEPRRFTSAGDLILLRYSLIRNSLDRSRLIRPRRVRSLSHPVYQSDADCWRKLLPCFRRSCPSWNEYAKELFAVQSGGSGSGEEAATGG